MIVAPNAAFDALREVPTWGWALLLACAGSILGSCLAIPAWHHYIDAALPSQLAANPQIAKLPASQQQTAIGNAIKLQHTFANFIWLLSPVILLIGYLVQAVAMLVARSAGRGDGSFRRFWALAINAGVIGNGLGTLALGLIATLRGAASFNSQADIQTALPSLALLAPGASPPLMSFLGTCNIFYLWAAVLLALGMIRAAKIRPAVAWITAALFVILPGAFAAWGAIVAQGQS